MPEATPPLRAVDLAAADEIAQRFNPRKMPWIAMKISEHMYEERRAAARVFDEASILLSQKADGGEEWQRLDAALKVVRGET